MILSHKERYYIHDILILTTLLPAQLDANVPRNSGIFSSRSFLRTDDLFPNLTCGVVRFFIMVCSLYRHFGNR